MSLNTNAMPQLTTTRRPNLSTSNNKIRTLGTSRGALGKRLDYSLPTSRSEARRKRDDVNKTSLCLKDITQFDLLSPFTVQKLTGDVSTAFPSVPGKQSANIKMVNIQLPRAQYTSLPRLALTNNYRGNEIKDDARTVLTRKLSRSQSELSHYRKQEPNLGNHERPHPEGKLTGGRHDTGAVLAGKYESKHKHNGKQDPDINGNTVINNNQDSAKITDRYQKQETEIWSRKRETSPSHGGKVQRLSKNTAKSRPAKTAEKMADLSISEYTEVKEGNQHISGQVWSQGKAKTDHDSSRTVRFNTSNDVYEYFL